MRVTALLTCCLLATAVQAAPANYLPTQQQARTDYVNTEQLNALREQTASLKAMQEAQAQQLQAIQAIQAQQAQQLELQRQTNQLLQLQLQTMPRQ